MPGLFDAEPVQIGEMLACARRELAMRESVYPRWIAGGKMKPEKAENELRLMRAIVAHFEAASG